MYNSGSSLPHFSHLLQGPQWCWQVWERIAKVWQWSPLWSRGQWLPQPMYGHTKCTSEEETLDTVDPERCSKHTHTQTELNTNN